MGEALQTEPESGHIQGNVADKNHLHPHIKAWCPPKRYSEVAGFVMWTIG